MFTLFKKKEINVEKVNAFCDWFIANQEDIKQSVINSSNDRMKMMMYLDLVEKELAKVYRDFYKGEIYFGYGPIPKSNKWNLDLCHFNKKPLIKITTIIQEKLTKELKDSWVIKISK
jgi:hypothetical protein